MVVAVRLRSIIWFAAGALASLMVVWILLSAWRVEAAPGDPDATFVPISPCRVVDQRETTPMTSGGLVTQQITGTNGDCTIPSDAIAVAMNVTIARPSARSFLTVFPADLESPPDVSNLNWLAASSPIPNKVDVKLSPDGAVKFYNNNGTVVVIGDIVGYYTDLALGELDSRLAALETTGVSRAALERIEALEAEATAMASQISVLETTLGAVSDPSGNWTFPGDVTVLGSLAVDGSIAAGGEAAIGRSLSVGGALGVGGGANVGSNLSVDGSIAATDDAAIGGSLSLGRSLRVGAGANIGSSLSVDGSIAASGDVITNGDFIDNSL